MLLNFWNFFLCLFNSLAHGVQAYNTLEAESHYLRGEHARMRLRTAQLEAKLAALTPTGPRIEVQLPPKNVAFEKLQEENTVLKAELDATKKQSAAINDKNESMRQKLITQSETLKELRKEAHGQGALKPATLAPTGTAGN